MAGKKIKWTEQQRRAIAARGSDVLVTASAGTGKTAVLSGRCVSIVSDKGVCPDVWSILVLTFTDAAAEHMRSRIAGQLRVAFLEGGDSHLRRQVMLLQGADISTIHSFCKRLITEYFYKLGLDPTFRIIDADEQRLLKAEVLEQTIDWAWRQSNLQQALELLLRRRDLRTNDGFLAKIIYLSDFLDSVVSREKWYERAVALAEAVNPGTAELGQEQKRSVADKLEAILHQLRHARELYENESPGGDWPAKFEDTFIEPVEGCVGLLKSGDWDKCAEQIRNFKKPRVSKPKELPETIAELIQRTVRKAVNAFVALSELAVLNPEYLDKVGFSAGLQTNVLVELVRKFDRLYARAKQAINSLDFADLEHYALKLLTKENTSAGRPLPSQTARALRRRYKYIFVDEYQDINPVQQAILERLSSEGNVFVVGDVKQSIYAWRGAKPEIFIERLKPASIDPKDAAKGLRVDLNANFRSAQGILHFVNKIFGRIMTSSFAKIEYDESARLRPAGESKSKEQASGVEGSDVEVHLLDEQDKRQDLEDGPANDSVGGGDESTISPRQRQAAVIARRIRQMVGAETGRAEFDIYDKEEGEPRGVDYRDIVILMRSPAKRANDYVEVLRLAGVPIGCEAAAGYFETTEISDLLCLLKVLDNPQRDIELAAVLRSPFFTISDTELARIKMHSKTDEHKRDFYDCVLRYCAKGPDAKLAEKLKGMLEQIERWRTAARRGSLSELIWQIYRETGFLAFVSALPNGQARRANLLKLHDRAIQFEGFASSGGGLSLARFVEFIERLQEAGWDWSPAEPEAAAENAVRIMSVHKSKGLEFPVVFLAELDSRFNTRDFQEELLADADNTLGLQIIEPVSNSKLSSLGHQVVAERKRSTCLAEEMRILYVATTRASERLILTASAKQDHCRDIICDGFFLGHKPIGDWQLRSCQSPLEWLLYGLSDQSGLHEAFETGLHKGTKDDDLFSLKVYRPKELKRLRNYILKLKAEKSRGPRWSVRKMGRGEPQSTLLRQLKTSLAWRYRFGDVPLLPAKLSVTQITHGGDEYGRPDYFEVPKPSAILSADLPGAADRRLIGTATHLVIAQLDLGRPITKQAIEKTIERLSAEEAITEATAEQIDSRSIMGFFESELGKKVLDGGSMVWREWPFTLAVPARAAARAQPVAGRIMDHGPELAEDETTVIQGIIDMLVRTPEGLLVIDFKTDNIMAEEIRERAELYRQPLELYSRAASAIIGAKAVGRWLYFLTPGSAIEV